MWSVVVRQGVVAVAVVVVLAVEMDDVNKAVATVMVCFTKPTSTRLAMSRHKPQENSSGTTIIVVMVVVVS